MFGRQTADLNSVAKDLNSVANAKWHELVDHLSATEAGRRTTTAWDALAGRHTPSRGWPMIRGAVLGVALGWAAHEFYRRRKPEIDQTIDQTVDRVGQELREAKHNLDDRIAKAKATPGSPIDKAKAAAGTGSLNAELKS